jgi:uncharacterized OB-fold protein
MTVTGFVFRDPRPSEVGETYWEYARKGDLACQRCLDCGRLHRYLSRVCPHCGSTSYEWDVLGGLGTVYACSVAYFGLGEEFPPPYVVALIDLDEGVRMMSNVVDRDPESVAIGDRVEVRFDRVSDTISLPIFVPLDLEPGDG